MLDISVLPVLFTVIFFLSISPGPDMVLLSAFSSTQGIQSGLIIAMGIFLSGLLQTLLVALGLGQLMESLPGFAIAVKWIGACYLGYLGIKMLLSWHRNDPSLNQYRAVDGVKGFSLVRKGFFNNLLNPKALVFFSLFLPQFTTADSDISTQILLLGLLVSGFALMMNVIFAILFSQMGKLIGNKVKMGRHTDGFLGIIFLGLATRLMVSK